MKTLIYFITEHSINWPLIWSDCSIYVCIWLILVMLVVIWAANNYRESVKYEAEDKSNGLVVSLSHELDMLQLQNSYLRDIFKNYKEDVQIEINSLRERLSRSERKRDAKGLYLPTTGKGHGKKKDWTKATEEQLIKEAKRRYPIGTKFKDAHKIPENGIFESSDDFEYIAADIYTVVRCGYTVSKISVCVWSLANGWAKIIK